MLEMQNGPPCAGGKWAALEVVSRLLLENERVFRRLADIAGIHYQTHLGQSKWAAHQLWQFSFLGPRVLSAGQFDITQLVNAATRRT